MSSPIESHTATNDVDESVELVASSKSVTLSDELRDTVAVASVEGPNTESTSKHKRKKTSEVWKFFVAKQVNEKGKMVQKLECIYCKQRYKGVMGGPTTSLRRHIDGCASIKKAQDQEQPPKSDLEVYLEEPRYSVEDMGVTFDVLKWWNQNSSKYPILSKLARDVLAIPITTVASESAFSAGGRILDDYRSSLSKDMVEILVCGSDWIKASSRTTIQTLQKSAKEEENLEFQIPTSNV
jgi:hypothetical protein